jgi:hypothetical protein
MAEVKEGYKGHRVGSNKGKVHMVFDEKGKDAAIKKAVALEIQETTARTWCSTWGAGKGKKKVAKAAPAKKAVKKTAKKAPAKKAAKKAAPAKVKRERAEEQASA